MWKSDLKVIETSKSEISANFGETNAPPQNLVLNVFGKRGVGKTRTVVSAVQYLRYRYLF